MYLPSILILPTPSFPPPLKHKPKNRRDRNHNNKDIHTSTQELVGRFEKMHPVAKKAALVVGLGVIGLTGMAVAGKLMPSKNQAVVWRMGGELDRVNDEVEKQREKIFEKDASGNPLPSNGGR